VNRPLVALALAFALGAALPPHPSAFPAAAAALPALALPPTAAIAFAGLGWAARTAAQAAPATGAARVDLEGTVTSVPERFDERIRFTLRERGGRTLLAWAAAPDWPLALGDRIRFPARLRPPEPRRNPGGRDAAGLLAARGIALEAHALAPPVRVGPPSPLASLEAGRRRFAALAAETLPRREAALVRAIGAGDRDGMEPADEEAFARSGLVHVLSVSGLHLAVVALGAFKAARAVLARCEAVAARADPRRAAALVALPIAAVYAVATGASVPALRAAVAAGAGFGGVLLDRELDGASALALAALAILAFEPGAVLDPSLQLSFASVAGLLAGARPLREALPLARREGRLGRAREALLVAVCASAAATLATAPIVALHFRRVPLAGVLANVAGVPLGSALTIAATLAALASALAPPLGVALLWACRPLALALLAVADVAAAPAWASPGVASPGPALALAACALAFAALRTRGRLRLACAAAAAAALLLPGPARQLAARWNGELEVVFLSVGHGDAALLRLPDGSAALVDGGGDLLGHADPGARDVVPFLRDAGLRSVAAAFLSHAHPDHLLGLPAVHAALGLERLFGPDREPPADAAAALARLPRMERMRRGDRWERAGVGFEALGPPPGSAAWTENDASLALRVRYGDTVFLFLGDVEAEGERALVAEGGDGLRADVVKVPHHGSGTSSGPALIAATRPRWAVASMARDSRYGFPAPEVVARWRAAGAELLRTDAGAVAFASDGRRVRRTPPGRLAGAVAALRDAP
jgi:competence protein ComEC